MRRPRTATHWHAPGWQWLGVSAARLGRRGELRAGDGGRRPGPARAQGIVSWPGSKPIWPAVAEHPARRGSALLDAMQHNATQLTCSLCPAVLCADLLALLALLDAFCSLISAPLPPKPLLSTNSNTTNNKNTKMKQHAVRLQSLVARKSRRRSTVVVKRARQEPTPPLTALLRFLLDRKAVHGLGRPRRWATEGHRDLDVRIPTSKRGIPCFAELPSSSRTGGARSEGKPVRVKLPTERTMFRHRRPISQESVRSDAGAFSSQVHIAILRGSCNHHGQPEVLLHTARPRCRALRTAWPHARV